MKKWSQVLVSVFLQKSTWVLEYCTFVILSLIFAAAPTYTDTSAMELSLDFCLRFVCSFVLLVVTYSVFYFLCNRTTNNAASKISLRQGFDINDTPRTVALLALILLLFWAPYAICLYPGVVFFDTSFQLAQFFGNPSIGIFPMPDDAHFTDHHPLFDTLLFGSFVKLGTILASSNVGMFMYLIVQAILTAASFAYAISYMRNKLIVPKSACYAAMVFLALCPIIPIFVFSMTKDSLFSWLYIIFLIQVIEIVRTRGEFIAHPKKLLTVILIALLLSLTKKTGVYIVLLSFVFLSIFLRKYWISFAAIAMVPLVTASIIIPMLVFPLLNVAPGSKVEVLGFFYQQTARYVSDYPEDVTQQEAIAISGVLDFERLSEQYTPEITNTIKNVGTGANLWPTNSQILEYVQCYLAQGFRHPDAYFNAIASLESGWFDWSDTVKLPTVSGLSLATENGEPNIYRTGTFQALSDRLATVLEQIETFFPVSLLLRMPLYSIVIPIFITLYLRKQNNGLLLATVPIWVSFIFLMMSPVSLASNAEAQRYLLPFIYSAPMALMMCVASLSEAKIQSLEKVTDK